MMGTSSADSRVAARSGDRSPTGAGSLETPAASVVIICYNHGRFLSEAIESALGQTLPDVEVVVVDDGSTDDTPQVAARYPVRYIRQENQGMSAARNAGLRSSRGRFVAFLDADDRLLPNALRAGAACLEANPDCAFASGLHRMIGVDGTPLPSRPHAPVRSDHYRALLEENYIGMHAAVLFRREALESIGGSNPSMRACDDYDVYLRIARTMPVACHEEVVAEYRWHGANTSYNWGLMLRSTLGPLRSQWRFVRGHADLEVAYRKGIRNWQRYYGTRLLNETGAALRNPKRWGAAALALATLLRHYPRGVWERAVKRLFPRAGRRRVGGPKS